MLKLNISLFLYKSMSIYSNRDNSAKCRSCQYQMGKQINTVNHFEIVQDYFILFHYIFNGKSFKSDISQSVKLLNSIKTTPTELFILFRY